MGDYALAIAVALTGWWFFTGAILWLVHSASVIRGPVFLVWTLFLLPTLMLIDRVAATTTMSSVVLAFTLALVVWGWLEMGYLNGWVTGSRQSPCSKPHLLATRLREGIATCLYHELCLLGLLALIAAATWDAANPVSLMTFSVLWVMRWSAKLNLVMGVRNYNNSWLPDHLDYLDSYIPKRRINGLFPFSLLAGLTLSGLLAYGAATAATLPDQIGLTLVAALAVLGTLEHVFLMLPLRDAMLWQWAAPESEDGHYAKMANEAFQTGEPRASQQ